MSRIGAQLFGILDIRQVEDTWSLVVREYQCRRVRESGLQVRVVREGGSGSACAEWVGGEFNRLAKLG